jgi:hypothetical protein
MMKDLDSITCIEDLKKLARKRTPKISIKLSLNKE